MKRRFRKLWLCVPFAVMGLLDGALTLYGQSAQYWGGDTSALNEAFPMFAKALQGGPLFFAGLLAAWILVFCAGIVLLPDFFAEALSVALVNGHTWGAVTWLICEFQVRYEAAIGVFLLSAILFVACDRRWRKKETPA
jgi:hypothetical protein